MEPVFTTPAQDEVDARIKFERVAESRAFNERVATAAGRGVDLGPENHTNQMIDAFVRGEISNKDIAHISDRVGKDMTNLIKGGPAGFVGGAGDLTSMATAVGYNMYKMSQGQSWDWPEDFNNVPATSDYFGDALSADTRSLGFMMGAVALTGGKQLDPSDLRHFSSRALKTAKALQGGRKAALARKSVAEELYVQGKLTSDEIWKQTGWKKLLNGKMAFFLSDADSKLKVKTLLSKVDTAADSERTLKSGEVVRTVNGRADEFLDHEAAWELYPQVAGTRVSVDMVKTVDPKTGTVMWKPYDNPRNKGSFLAGEGGASDKITVSSGDARSTLLHEIQHSIQKQEGFDTGSAAEIFTDSVDKVRFYNVLVQASKDPDALAKVGSRGQMVDFVKSLDPGLDAHTRKLLSNRLLKLAQDGDEAGEELFSNMAQLDKAQNETKRWLEQLFQGNEAEVKSIMGDLSTPMIEELARMRYLQQEGEVNSRLIQAMRFMDQETIDNLPASPQTLQARMEEFLRGRAMKEPIKESDTIVGKIN